MWLKWKAVSSTRLRRANTAMMAINLNVEIASLNPRTFVSQWGDALDSQSQSGKRDE